MGGQQIRISCNTRDSLPFSQIEEFQGNLKKRSKKEISKIITSILKYGFSFPFFVWKDGGRNRFLDGHGRLLALGEMTKRHYFIDESGSLSDDDGEPVLVPDLFPCVGRLLAGTQAFMACARNSERERARRRDAQAHGGPCRKSRRRKASGREYLRPGPLRDNVPMVLPRWRQAPRSVCWWLSAGACRRKARLQVYGHRPARRADSGKVRPCKLPRPVV